VSLWVPAKFSLDLAKVFDFGFLFCYN
jgi:hypothetical protein